MRTPDERFAGLPGFSYAPRYLPWHGLRAHYVDEAGGHFLQWGEEVAAAAASHWS